MNGAADAIKEPDRNTAALKQENSRLKKLVAERALVIDRSKKLNESVRRGKKRVREVIRLMIAVAVKHYNETRPHSSLGYLTPREYGNRFMEKVVE